MSRKESEVIRRNGKYYILIYVKAKTIPEAHGKVVPKFNRMYSNKKDTWVRNNMWVEDPNGKWRNPSKYRPHGMKTFKVEFRERRKSGRKSKRR